jgi:hypothetical protein
MDENKFFKALAMHASVTSPINGDASSDARSYEAIFRASASGGYCSSLAENATDRAARMPLTSRSLPRVLEGLRRRGMFATRL